MEGTGFYEQGVAIRGNERDNKVGKKNLPSSLRRRSSCDGQNKD